MHHFRTYLIQLGDTRVNINISINPSLFIFVYVSTMCESIFIKFYIRSSIIFLKFYRLSKALQKKKMHKNGWMAIKVDNSLAHMKNEKFILFPTNPITIYPESNFFSTRGTFSNCRIFRSKPDDNNKIFLNSYMSSIYRDY